MHVCKHGERAAVNARPALFAEVAEVGSAVTLFCLSALQRPGGEQEVMKGCSP